MSRREIREQIFRMLFRIEFHKPEEIEEQFHYCLDGEVTKEASDMTDEERTYITEKVEKIKEKIPEIDAMINELAKGWKTTRMGKVDLTLIRLAVYEIRFDDDVPTGVAINEAVEIAKKYGANDSSAFVNGVLAKFA